MKRLNFFMGAAALVAVFMTAAINLSAQENGNRDEFGNIVRGPYETNRFGDNWFIGSGGGVNMFFSEGYKAKVAPSLDVNFGKWFTPSIGMRAGYQGLDSRVMSGNSLQKFGYMYFHGDFLWNVSNAFGGYKETRFWNLIPYVHAGYYRADGISNAEGVNEEMAGGAGLLHNLRLSDRLDLIIDMRATLVDGAVIGGSGATIFPSVTMGMAIDLGRPNFVRTASVIEAVEMANAEKTAIMETAIRALESANLTLSNENRKLTAKNSNLEKQISRLNNTIIKETDAFADMSPMTLYFEIGQTVLDEKELQHLDFYLTKVLGAAMEEAPISVIVMGSADSNTGTAGRNTRLSEARGKYILNLMTHKYGIDPQRLDVRSKVVKASSKPEMSRSVIISFE